MPAGGRAGETLDATDLGRRGGWGLTLWTALACGLVCTVVAWRSYEPHTFLFGDCPYYAAAAVSLIADGDLQIRNNIQGGAEIHAGQVSVGADGEWRPKHPVLMSVVSVPFLLMFGVKGLLIFNVAVLTLLAGLTHRIALRGASAPVAALATAITFLMTFVVTYAYNYSPDAFAAIPGLLALLFLLDRRPLAAGIAAGLAFLAKPVHVLLVAIAGLVVLRTTGWRGGLRYAAGAIPSAVAVMVYNTLLFGGPLTFSYDRILYLETGTVSQRADFDLALIPGNLTGQFLDVQHGLLFTAPSALVALLGVAILWRRRRREAMVPLLVALGYVAFFSTYAPWMTSHFGNRFLFIPVLASALPLAALLGRVRFRGAAPAAAPVTPS